ncbi:MAG: hypothetical protein KAS39_08645 [Actinomycetia bacterium]|nr:hypothetical protein [Actinomycetes bacterium]
MKIQILFTRLLIIFFVICSFSPALALQRDHVTLSVSETGLLSYEEAVKEEVTDSYASESQSVINNFQLFYLYDRMMVLKNMKLAGVVLTLLGGAMLTTGIVFDIVSTQKVYYNSFYSYYKYRWALIPGLISTIGGGIMLLICVPLTIFAHQSLLEKKEKLKALTGLDFISISEYNLQGLSFSCSF